MGCGTCVSTRRAGSICAGRFGAARGQTRSPISSHGRGARATIAALKRGSRWALVGLVYDWDEYEALFAEHGLPPQVPAGAWRTGVPVYDENAEPVGQATSGAWSPLLKKNLALATVAARVSAPGTKLQAEVTVEYRRRQVTATVTALPFFDPPRKRA